MRMLFSQKSKMWFPTSNQLHNFLKINIKGKICSDFYPCWQNKLGKFPKYNSYIVGDNVYEK
jgi:hypothetical protein